MKEFKCPCCNNIAEKGVVVVSTSGLLDIGWYSEEEALKKGFKALTRRGKALGSEGNTIRDSYYCQKCQKVMAIIDVWGEC